MNWEKVVKALDDEWWNRKQAAEKATGAEREKLIITAAIAFMLRDALQAGLPVDKD